MMVNLPVKINLPKCLECGATASGSENNHAVGCPITEMLAAVRVEKARLAFECATDGMRLAALADLTAAEHDRRAAAAERYMRAVAAQFVEVAGRKG